MIFRGIVDSAKSPLARDLGLKLAQDLLGSGADFLSQLPSSDHHEPKRSKRKL